MGSLHFLEDTHSGLLPKFYPKELTQISTLTFQLIVSLLAFHEIIPPLPDAIHMQSNNNQITQAFKANQFNCHAICMDQILKS